MNNIFVAVSPGGIQENPELKQLLGKMKRTLNDREVEARWVRPDLWHVTTAFLGPLAEERRLLLLEALRRWKPNASDVELRLHGLGGYPTSEQARVLWVGVGENQEFLRLQSDLADFLSRHGFEITNRNFHPHMTLARLRHTQSLTDVIQLGGRKHFGDYPVREFIVFHSLLEGNILKYLPLARLPIVAGIGS